MLSQLIYASDALDDLGTDPIPAFMDRARVTNRDCSLSGVLVFDGRHFLQCLEGDRENVTGTFRRIANDPRHANITLTSVTDISQRSFPDWSMGFLRLAALDRDEFRRLVPSGHFDPRSMTPAAAIGILTALQGTGHTV